MRKDEFIPQAISKILRVLKEHLNKEEFKHLDKLYIVGSQSIRGSIKPVEGYLIGTADMDFLLEESAEENEYKKILSEELIENLCHIIDINSGNGTPFYKEFGYYLDMLDSNILLPDNWKKRTIQNNFSLIMDKEIKNIKVCYLSKEDLVLAKLNAYRKKDLNFIEDLCKKNLISFNKLDKIWKQSTNFKEKIYNKNPEKLYLIEDKMLSLYNIYSKKNPTNQSKFKKIR